MFVRSGTQTRSGPDLPHTRHMIQKEPDRPQFSLIWDNIIEILANFCLACFKHFSEPHVTCNDWAFGSVCQI